MNIHQSTELDTTLLVSNKPEIWWWWSLLNVTNMEACANRILKIVFVWRLLIYPYVVSVVDTDTGQGNKSGEYLCLITYPCIAGGSYSGPVQSTHCHHQKPQQIIISQKWRKLKEVKTKNETMFPIFLCKILLLLKCLLWHMCVVYYVEVSFVYKNIFILMMKWCKHFVSADLLLGWKLQSNVAWQLFIWLLHHLLITIITLSVITDIINYVPVSPTICHFNESIKSLIIPHLLCGIWQNYTSTN